ncbi:hypothetical protein BgiBS90_021358 [Biomphalaria glabrata]|nr:hypothetical protein BgiBS90_021358 [Biomphalaria glabrata]
MYSRLKESSRVVCNGPMSVVCLTKHVIITWLLAGSLCWTNPGLGASKISVTKALDRNIDPSSSTTLNNMSSTLCGQQPDDSVFSLCPLVCNCTWSNGVAVICSQPDVLQELPSIPGELARRVAYL